MVRKICWTVVAALVLSAPALAERSIDPNHPFAWGENIGWTNWQHDRPNPGDGVLVHDEFLEGFIWAENVGWINVGNGSGPYANTTGLDFGVNLDPSTGLLSGNGWGENIGWINFLGGALAAPSNPARLEWDAASSDCRFRGYVWGENVGWINLDDADKYVAVLLEGDLDHDGDVDLTDLGILLAHYGMTSGAEYEDGDIDGDGDVDLTDLGILLRFYGTSCP
jgi:hypothetical protein